MARAQPESPGWYPDPDITPGSKGDLRYWNGRHWTDRRRHTPVFTNLDLHAPLGLRPPRALEGPAQTAELPAPAAEVPATRDRPGGRDGPGGRADTMDRPTEADGVGVEMPTSAGRVGGTPPHVPEVGGGGSGGGGGGGGEPDGAARTRKRRRWWVFAGVAVLCALAVTVAGQAMRPPSPGPRVLTDGRFVRLANDDCARTMPTLRPPDGGPFGSQVTPAKAADQIDRAAAGLDDLANRLANLPAAPPDQPHIAAWLDGWHRYDAVGHQYADHLRQHGATGKAPAVLKTGADLAKRVDNFARANGLGACLFAFAYTPDPSQF